MTNSMGSISTNGWPVQFWNHPLNLHILGNPQLPTGDISPLIHLLNPNVCWHGNLEKKTCPLNKKKSRPDPTWRVQIWYLLLAGSQKIHIGETHYKGVWPKKTEKTDLNWLPVATVAKSVYLPIRYLASLGWNFSRSWSRTAAGHGWTCGNPFIRSLGWTVQK